MGESRRGDPNRFKREGAKGWVSIPRRREPRFDYPVPCINDVVEVREVVLQKKMPASLRKYYKRSRKLILTRYEKLRDV